MAEIASHSFPAPIWTEDEYLSPEDWLCNQSIDEFAKELQMKSGASQQSLGLLENKYLPPEEPKYRTSGGSMENVPVTPWPSKFYSGNNEEKVLDFAENIHMKVLPVARGKDIHIRVFREDEDKQLRLATNIQLYTEPPRLTEEEEEPERVDGHCIFRSDENDEVVIGRFRSVKFYDRMKPCTVFYMIAYIFPDHKDANTKSRSRGRTDGIPVGRTDPFMLAAKRPPKIPVLEICEKLKSCLFPRNFIPWEQQMLLANSYINLWETKHGAAATPREESTLVKKLKEVIRRLLTSYKFHVQLPTDIVGIMETADSLSNYNRGSSPIPTEEEREVLQELTLESEKSGQQIFPQPKKRKRGRPAKVKTEPKRLKIPTKSELSVCQEHGIIPRGHSSRCPECIAQQ